ncbi:rhomboid-like protein 19 [Macadamia integrifolia]|uniref:rhomboid-like protein 19 n=1 Tax=Macadamia integrifolia TaxID=60698 RepID=UPI001C4FD6CA|nr:rhomboid-like protein 19 [Macadamia integrifolia]
MVGHIMNAELQKLYRELAESQQVLGENQQKTDARLERNELKLEKLMEEMIAFMKRSDKRVEEGSSTPPLQIHTLRIEDKPHRQQPNPIVHQDVTRQFSDRDYGIEIEVLEFNGKKGPKEFLDWFTEVERIFAYKFLLDEKCGLILTKFISHKKASYPLSFDCFSFSEGKIINLQMGSSFFSGFTRLCKGLVVVLVGGYAIVQILPPAVTYLGLIPARTIPFGWNLITAGYIDQSIFGVVFSAVGLLFLGKVLEPIWGSWEFLKFVFVVNFLTYICVFVTAISLYYITRQELFLYTPRSGFHGVLLGFLVGIKQIVPDQELSAFSLLKIKAKWFPSLVLLMSIAISFFTAESASYLPTLVFGTYTSWIYLRYLQRKPETNLMGDPSEEFSFSTFFPEFLRPIIDPIALVLDCMVCGRSRSSNEAKGYTAGGTPLPGSDPIEATRRRERGARALEERLATERLAAGGSADNLPSKVVAESV